MLTEVLQIKSLHITKVDSILAQYETVLVLDRAAQRPLPQSIKTLQVKILTLVVLYTAKGAYLCLQCQGWVKSCSEGMGVIPEGVLFIITQSVCREYPEWMLFLGEEYKNYYTGEGNYY